MKRLRTVLSVVLAIIVALSVFGCKNDELTPKETVVCALNDPNFEDGFNLRGLSSATDSGIVKVINYGDETKVPAWGIAQWWSKHNLKDGMETVASSDYILADISKRVALKRKTGAITLGVDGSNEFAAFQPTPPPEWPHLLIEQQLKPNMWIKDADRVDVSLDFTLNKSENLRGGNVGLNAQFAWFMYLVDKNPDSEGYGNFLWFGINLYDSLKLYAPASAQQDTAGGPGNFIYTLGSKDVFEERVRVGENIKFKIDILSHVEKAITTAQSKGFMMGTEPNDCMLTGMNIGWEVFDRWNVDITLYDIGIDMVTKIDDK